MSNTKLSFMLLLIASVVVGVIIASVSAMELKAKTFEKYPIAAGIYSISFSANCPLMLGLFDGLESESLYELPYRIPDHFKIIANNVASFTSDFKEFSLSYSLGDFILFNNGTQSCNVSQFRNSMKIYNLTTTPTLMTLPSYIAIAFRIGNDLGMEYNQFTIEQNSYDSARIFFMSDLSDYIPTSAPSSYEMQDYPIYRNDPKTWQVRTDDFVNTTTYVYLKCAVNEGCPVSVSIGKPTYGEIIGPVVGVVALAIICIVGVIVALIGWRVYRYYKGNPVRSKLLHA